jgi:KDO2-lipid IV(A) lauroyltransferase
MALKPLAMLTGILPISALEALGRWVGRLAYGLDIRHRRIIHQNLAFIYPELALPDRRQLARRIFQHFGIVFFEIFQATFLSREKLIDRVDVQGLEILQEAMQHPRGCLVYSAHIGNWELCFLALSARLDDSITTVAKPIKWQTAHRWLTALRSRFGNRVAFKEGAMPFMMKALHEGRTVAMLIDQGVRRTEAVEVMFFGKRTMATPAAALMALRRRMPVVPIFCLRRPDGRYQIKIEPPVAWERTASLRDDIKAYTQILMQVLENPIHQNPEQWFWFHKRWKRTYPELYPHYQVRRRRKRIKKGLAP